MIHSIIRDVLIAALIVFGGGLVGLAGLMLLCLALGYGLDVNESQDIPYWPVEKSEESELERKRSVR